MSPNLTGRPLLRLLLLTLPAVLSLGCPRRPKTPPPARVNQDSVAREQARRDSLARADADRRAADAAARDRARADSARMEQDRLAREADARRLALTAAVYFDYDQAELSDQARATLDAKIPLLQQNSALRLRIVGHTDSRGSDEYNLALGQRRAAAAKRYLSSRQIGETRLEVTSLGEEQPAAAGEDEASWAQNRRAEFEVIGGESGGTP